MDFSNLSTWSVCSMQGNLKNSSQSMSLTWKQEGARQKHGLSYPRVTNPQNLSYQSSMNYFSLFKFVQISVTSFTLYMQGQTIGYTTTTPHPNTPRSRCSPNTPRNTSLTNPRPKHKNTKNKQTTYILCRRPHGLSRGKPDCPRDHSEPTQP
jgi:hypothetical protein